MKIKVIGGGWYGCHIAAELLAAGEHEVTLVEKADRLFAGASTANQSRTHLGFHYPRCAHTRNQAISGSLDFIRRYPTLSRAVSTNIYAIAREDSYIDWTTYRTIMASHDLGMVEVQPADFGMRNIEGACLTGERLILPAMARRYFEQLLDGHVTLNKKMVGTDVDADVVVNATWGGVDMPGCDYYEPCVLFIYDLQNDREGVGFALTVMDGPHGVSMYPWETANTCSLTSVEHTPVRHQCETYAEAEALIDAQTEEDWTERRTAMELRMSHYLPWFEEAASYRERLVGIRALPHSLADRRTFRVEREGNVIHARPGKITSVGAVGAAVKRHIADIDRERTIWPTQLAGRA